MKSMIKMNPILSKSHFIFTTTIRLLGIIIHLFLANLCLAQIPDTIPSTNDSIAISNPLLKKLKRPLLDSQTVVKKNLFTRVFKSGKVKQFWREGYPNPKKAVWMSLALPGAGQIYNKQYWKLPIVYGGYTGLILLLRHNRFNYLKLKRNYIAILDEDPTTVVDEDIVWMDAPTIRRNRDKFRKDRELSWLYIIGFHLLQTADAFVFAHLKSFNVNDDLSLSIDPKVDVDLFQQANIGLHLTLHQKVTTPKPILFFGP